MIAIGVLMIIAAVQLFNFFDARWLSRAGRINAEAILKEARRLRTASRQEIEHEEAFEKEHPFEVRGYTSRDERYERLADLLRFEQLMCRRFELDKVEGTARVLSTDFNFCKAFDHRADNLQQELSKAPTLQF